MASLKRQLKIYNVKEGNKIIGQKLPTDLKRAIGLEKRRKKRKKRKNDEGGRRLCKKMKKIAQEKDEEE